MASLPYAVGIQSMTMRLVSATAMTQSVFTFDQQVFAHQGVRWEAEVTLPPMNHSQARAYTAFFASLRGMKETFTMYNPLHNVTATGTITGSVGDTNVTLSSVSGSYTLGDHFEVNNRLYMITSVPSGNNFDIMPPLRDNLTSAAVDFSNPVGTWRLASNDIGWSIAERNLYSFSFACVEAI